MSMLTKWNPMTELDALQNRMSSFFGSPLIRRPIGDGILPSDEWALPVDVSEGPTEFVITAELPEVKKEDVKITVEDGMLKIAGERKFEKEENGIKYHRIERSYGAFARSFVIPEGAKGDKVSAEFREGLLKVHLPKCEKARPKAIEIDVA